MRVRSMKKNGGVKELSKKKKEVGKYYDVLKN
jgi:hypothetical protein